MIGLIFKDIEGIEGFTEASNEAEAKEIIDIYTNKGYTLVKKFEEGIEKCSKVTQPAVAIMVM